MSPMPSPGEKLQERVKTQKKEPTLYKVVLLNDDYTTMEFVMEVLRAVFDKSPAEAYQIMMHVHTNGRGIAGIYPWEVADTKAAAVVDLARGAGFPLQAILEDV
jgi:ATP-dependent Clp protease adaptor protein ClpS